MLCLCMGENVTFSSILKSGKANEKPIVAMCLPLSGSRLTEGILKCILFYRHRVSVMVAADEKVLE